MMRPGLVLAVLLLVACAGPSPSPTSEPARILAQNLVSRGDPFSVALASSADEYTSIWRDLRPLEPTTWSATPPAVNFGSEVVIYLGMASSSSCPMTFDDLFVDHEALHVFGEWQATSSGAECTADLAPHGVLVAVSRAALPSRPFTLSLSQRPACSDCTDDRERLTVDLSTP